MITITCYGGVQEIGGSKIILQDGENCLSFDFGTSFGERYKYFEEYLNPRPGVGLKDLLRMGLLPRLGGIYREDLLLYGDLKEWLHSHPEYRELHLDGVLLSHAHIDHSGYISFLDEGIPIYSSAMTAFIAKAIQDSSPSSFEKEVCYSRRRELKKGALEIPRSGPPYKQRPFVFVDHMPSPGVLASFWEQVPVRKGIEPGPVLPSPGRAGSLPLRYFPVDHSIYGATAFAVETSRGWVAHTGDLRLHGGKSDQTEKFIQEMRKLEPLALLCEGTRIDSAKRVSEEEVHRNALAKVQEAQGLVVADFGPRNVERLITFYRIAQETGRKLVILGKDAYLLEAMRLVSPDVPDIAALPDILIYEDVKVVLSSWERELRGRYGGKLVDASDIHRQQAESIICFSFWDVKNLVDIEPEPGESIYIYSSSEAYSEEQRMDLVRLRNWLDYFQMAFVGDPEREAEEGLHASGHASAPELFQIIRGIKPEFLIPIHTLEPEIFSAELAGEEIEVLIPELGEDINI